MVFKQIKESGKKGKVLFVDASDALAGDDSLSRKLAEWFKMSGRF